MNEKIKELSNKIDVSALMDMTLTDWRPILNKECQVYVCGDHYIAKRFDQINFRFVALDEAKETLIDNLYALLRYKYFKKITEDIDKRIKDIILSFTLNLKSTLIKVSFDMGSDFQIVRFLSDSQVAFRNGVFDFKLNDWLFKYDIIKVPELSNTIYMYNPSYIINWYFDFNFEPLPFDINTTSLEDFIEVMKDYDKENKNYCFELMYNMSHDTSNNFSLIKFRHLCEILGYSIMQSFSQNFVFLIGEGQNGKNSLIDGCFTSRLVPRPANISMEDLETDRFITGALENKSHNIFLEASAKTCTESKVLKALTGSMYQTIEPKGITRYQGIINCKYIWAGNDQQKIKFADTTKGFRRRINIFEVFYTWDEQRRFLTKGDYYDTCFSDDLHEIKNDLANTIVYTYFAMYGILSGTNNFTHNFNFTVNDWKLSYSDIDFDLKDAVEGLLPEKIASYIKSNSGNYEECKVLFFDAELKKDRLYNSITMQELGYYNYDDEIKMLESEAAYTNYFAEHDVYISLKILQSILKVSGTAAAFNSSIKKLYPFASICPLYGNKNYLKVTFQNKRMRVLSD